MYQGKSGLFIDTEQLDNVLGFDQHKGGVSDDLTTGSTKAGFLMI
jgi:hypothetical protein